ncbi:hypothetical protein [Mycetocola spongiae]|uniref:hypothetical protein n=1 Tax=Mycetocola spongiae TaxID=2859226 RepID=UPI001CF3CEE7|nr:hypothetical protein [Mycetocola spongiae]UCR89238.1 hypothetical protein KXZ72_00550 [Mycetocola spongiae]
MPGDSVLVEAISTVGLLASITLTALVNRRVGRVAKDARSSRAQLENDHQADPSLTSNLREDMDEKHAESMGLMKTITKDIGGLRGDIRILHQADQATDERAQTLTQRLDDHLRKGH